MAKGKRRPIKFFDDAKTTTIQLKLEDTTVPVLGRKVEMSDGSSALWLMEGFFHMKPGKNFEAVDKFEDPNAAMNAAIAKLKANPAFQGFSDEQLAVVVQHGGMTTGGRRKSGDASGSGKTKIAKEVGQKWKHNDTGDVVTLTGKEGTSWLGKNKKGDQVKISGLTWNKYTKEG